MHNTATFLIALGCVVVILLATCTAGSVDLLELHGPDGQTVWLNPEEISTLRMPTAADLAHHFARGARCVVVTSNGKFIAITETCRAIRDRLARPTP